MQVLFFSLGAIIFLLILLDIIKTTFSSNGGGPLTSKVSRWVWASFFLLNGKDGHRKCLEYAGSAVLISVLFVWVTGMWSGFLLMLLSEHNSVVNSKTMVAADTWEKLYYAGFTLSTLGVGDFIPSDDNWRILTALGAYSGLIFITTSITYFVPVLSAVGLQNKLSVYIHSMGTTPQGILVNGWNGKNFSALSENISDLCQMIMQHTMHHHSYPVIHYFHSSKPKQSISAALALLHEVLLLLQHKVEKDVTLDNLKLNMLHTALDNYLFTVHNKFLKNNKPEKTAPSLALDFLTTAGIPLQPNSFDSTIPDEAKEKRALFTVLLEKDGWDWNTIYQANK